MRISVFAFYGAFIVVAIFVLSRYLSKSYLYVTSSTASCLSIIIETDQLNEVKSHLGESDTLVLFDIDNTLVSPKGVVGTDQWFSYLLQQKMNEGHEVNKALDIILPFYRTVQNVVSEHLAEPIIPDLLNYLRDHAISTLALTARGYGISDRTIEQLEEAGVPLPFTEFVDKPLDLMFNSLVSYKQGIIFCEGGRNDKGQVLFSIMDMVGFKPKKIIFVDDKYSNLLSLEKACVERDIPFVGIRYSRFDNKVTVLDPEQVEQEYQELFGVTVEAALNSYESIVA